MAEQIKNLIAKWDATWPSPLVVSRQHDNGQFRINLVDYPEPENYENQNEEILETINYYLVVWMKQSEDGEMEKLAPIQLPGPYWLVNSPYTQLVQDIKFQFYATSSVTGYIAHSAQFKGMILESLSGSQQQSVIPEEMWDAYKQYIEDKIIGAGLATIDPTLSISGAAADAKATGDAIANVNGRLQQHANDISQFAEDGRTNLVADFINGSMSSGVVVPSITYRVTSDQLFVFDRDVVLTPDEGFRFGIHSFGTDGAAFVSDSGWKTSAYTIPKGTYFKIVIQETEVSSGVADIPKLVSAVKVSTFISDSFNKVNNDIGLITGATVEYTAPTNLHNPAEDVNGALLYNGKEINTNDTSCITSGFIPVNEGDTVYYTAIGANGNYIGTGTTNMRWLAFYADADMTRAISCNSYQRNVTAPAGARYLRASFSDKTRLLHCISVNDYPASLSQMQNYFAPYYRNLAKPIIDEKVIDCWGDSRTAMSNDGTSFTDYLQTLLGNAYNVCNYGITSQSSGNVAMRLGANEVFVSLANNQIPSSGAVALSALRSMASDQFSVYAFSADAMSPCIIGGVRGRLNRSNTGDIAANTFVRDCDGVAVSVRPYAKVCVDDMGSKHHVCVFWWGKNDFAKYPGSTPNTQILDNYAAAVKYIDHDKFIILGETCSIDSNYEAGGSKRVMLDELNAELAAKYPNNFIDINAWLSSEEALTSVGLTLTDTDSEYIAKGWPCYQLMRYSTLPSDTVHPNEKGREAIANRIYAWLRSKYWV